jgi:hypothetical protein
MRVLDHKKSKKQCLQEMKKATVKISKSANSYQLIKQRPTAVVSRLSSPPRVMIDEALSFINSLPKQTKIPMSDALQQDLQHKSQQQQLYKRLAHSAKCSSEIEKIPTKDYERLKVGFL